MKRTIPHPIPYQGSKRQLAARILTYFPNYVSCLIEPFAGSAALSLAALSERRVGRVILADIDHALMSLWEQIIYKPEALARAYEQRWLTQSGCERHFYHEVRERFNQHRDAADFLFLLVRCVKAAIRYNIKGEFNQSADHRRRGTHPQTLRHHLLQTAHLLQARATLCVSDYRDTLAIASSSDVVYLDPPYQGVSGNRDSRYKAGVAFQDLINTLMELNKRNISYLLSYDGRTGNKGYGANLPMDLGLKRLELNAGRSTQATLLGKSEHTVESLYLSPSLQERLSHQTTTSSSVQLRLL